MSKTNVALLVGVGALAVVAYVAMKNRGGGTTAAVPGTQTNPTAIPVKPDRSGRATEEDWLGAGTSVVTALINNWGKGSQPAGK